MRVAPEAVRVEDRNGRSMPPRVDDGTFQAKSVGAAVEIHTNRLTAPVQPVAHVAVGSRRHATVNHYRNDEPSAYARVSAGTTLVPSNAAQSAIQERPENTTRSQPSVDPLPHTSFQGDVPLRAQVAPSLALSGTTSITRQDRVGAPHSMLTAATALPTDRSTPTRALTPNVYSNARYTPQVQIESTRG